jgi:protein dithiol oxidoreductase (disulfide-forming)
MTVAYGEMGKGALMKLLKCAALAAALTSTLGAPVRGAPTWTEGVNYFLIEPAHPTSLPPGKVEVTEVFSYACPACNLFVPTMHKLKASLPPNAVLDYLPASFNPTEDWPMFQLAYFTAQSLGVADQTHDAMFNAVWQSGELAVIDPATRGIKNRVPTIEDAARFYQARAGVPIDKFLAAAKSFSVDVKVRAAEGLIQTYRVDRTPTIVVNGKYRLNVESAGGPDAVIELVKWLVAKESN